MQSDNSQLVERLAWEGAVSGWTAAGMAVAIALVAAWSLWRERNVVGYRYAALFFLLRMVAFSVALWMLAGPTMQKVERTTTTQSIAIFADGSESMEVVDPAEPVDSLRWRLAIDSGADDSAVALGDRMEVALASALTSSQELARYVEEHRPLKQLGALASTIKAAVERASLHAESLLASLDGSDESLNERASRIVAMVDGPVTDAIGAVRASLDSAGQTLDENLHVRLEQLVEGITSARRRTAVFAADLAQSESDLASGRKSVVDGLTRREKAGQALDAFEESLVTSLGDNVRINRFRFDRQTIPIGTAGSWSAALENATSQTTYSELPSARGDEGAGADVATAGQATNLSAVLEQLASVRSGDSTRLAMILSDGRHNDVDAPAPQEVATRLAGLPVYVVPIGNSMQMRDVLLHRVEAPSTVAEKDSAVIDVIVTGFDCDGQASSVVLRHEGREVDRKPIEFAGGRGDQRVRFMVPAKELGWQEYVVEVEPIEDETNAANNFQPVSFEVVRDRLRILLADGIARWEYRYLNQLFRRDKHVECDELLFHPRLTGTGKLAERPRFPRDVESWSQYDVVILGDVSPRQLSAESQQSLAEFVRARGGNLIVVAGHNGMPGTFVGEPLMDLLPVEPAKDIIAQQGYGLRLTEEGRFQSALMIAESAMDSRDEWRRIYERFPVFELSEYCKPKSTARTLIEAVADSAGSVANEAVTGESSVEHAFLCWQRVGAGRVAYLAAPDTYRLRWRRGDRMHHRFWGQFLRWITAANAGAGSDVVRLQTDRTRYAAGEPVEVTAWLKDTAGRPLASAEIHAEARTFSDEVQSVDLTADADVPGRYFGTFNELPAGAYQIAARGKVIDELVPPGGDGKPAQTTITIRATDSIESLNTQSNRPLLEQVAQVTGGQVIPPTAIGEVLQLVSFTPEVHERIQRTPLWNRWSNLFIVLGCLFTEWVVRKSKGLV
jgi:hypothetical protein